MAPKVNAYAARDARSRTSARTTGSCTQAAYATLLHASTWRRLSNASSMSNFWRANQLPQPMQAITPSPSLAKSGGTLPKALPAGGGGRGGSAIRRRWHGGRLSTHLARLRSPQHDSGPSDNTTDSKINALGGTLGVAIRPGQGGPQRQLWPDACRRGQGTNAGTVVKPMPTIGIFATYG